MANTEITFQRPWGWNGMLRGVKIKIDGQDAGYVQNAKSLTVSVAPGSHEIIGQMDWVKSKRITITAVQGRNPVVKVKLCNAFLSLFAILGIIPYITLTEQ